MLNHECMDFARQRPRYVTYCFPLRKTIEVYLGMGAGGSVIILGLLSLGSRPWTLVFEPSPLEVNISNVRKLAVGTGVGVQNTYSCYSYFYSC